MALGTRLSRRVSLILISPSVLLAELGQPRVAFGPPRSELQGPGAF